MLRLGEEVDRVEVIEDTAGRRVRTVLKSAKQIVSDKVLCSVGRTGATSDLNLEAAGVVADDWGRIRVNECFQTSTPSIYAAGDVVGFPSLASASKEQGRLASCSAFGVEATQVRALFPYGIYTIPEMSFVGLNEEELTEQGVPYETGRAPYREIARGRIVGDSIGFVKMLFHRDTRELLGVHIIGEGAVELIHIGQAVLSLGGQIDYFIDTVFNYPTLAECYKNAAFDGINRLGSSRDLSETLVRPRGDYPGRLFGRRRDSSLSSSGSSNLIACGGSQTVSLQPGIAMHRLSYTAPERSSCRRVP